MELSFFNKILIFLLAVSIVLIGANEFTHRQRKLATEISPESVAEYANSYRQGNNYERAAFAPEHYEKIKNGQIENASSENQKRDLVQDISEIKNHITTMIAKFKEPTENKEIKE